MSLSKRLISTDAAGGADATANFAPVIYTGTGGVQSISSLSFAPDMVWIKKRSSATSSDHSIQDTIRGFSGGGSKILYPNLQLQESTNADANYFRSFDSNGFTLGGNTYYNGSSETYVAWCWKAGGTASDITSSSTGVSAASRSANPDAGFSIVTYTTNSNSSVVIPHGLNSTPSVALVKRTDSTSDWFFYNTVASGAGRGFLNNGNAFDNSGVPTFDSINLTFNAQDPFSSGSSAVIYFFADVAGYQKIGTYTGSGVSGKSVTTGFEPRFLIAKSQASDNWRIYDSVRGNAVLYANLANSEDAASHVTFNSTSFTWNTNNNNGNGVDYIYLAIA